MMRFLALPLLLLAATAGATEGGMGRPITGMQGYSAAGYIPAQPGWVLGLSSIYYSGDLERGRTVPLLGQVSSGMESTVSYNLASLTYVWGQSGGDTPWSAASSLGLPYQITRVAASFTTPFGGISGSDESSEFADILVTPLAVSYHISDLEHVSLSLPMYVPTGEYDVRQLANAGQNVWTVMPTMAYSKLDGKGGEFTSQAAFEMYSRNSDTQYRSGTLFRLDLFWLATPASNGLGWGIAGGWIQQVDDDDGLGSELSSGFKGSSLGFGPMLNWSGKFGAQTAAVNLKWVPEFYARNRPKGNGISLGLTLPLP